MATNTTLSLEEVDALRVLRNVLVDVGEPWRAYPEETYNYWEASLKYAYLLLDPGEDEDSPTLELSSALEELVDALEDLRDLKPDGEGGGDVRAEAVGPFEEALSEVTHALSLLDS